MQFSSSIIKSIMFQNIFRLIQKKGFEICYEYQRWTVQNQISFKLDISLYFKQIVFNFNPNRDFNYNCFMFYLY